MSRFFLPFLALFFLFGELSNAADQNIYLVENIVTSVSGKSPNDARLNAVNGARRDAFLVLLNRLELNHSIADSVTNSEISDMVRSEQIENEKISGNNYSASFNIMFAKNFVDHILAQKNLQKIDSKKEDSFIILLPKVDKNKISLWEEENDWKKAFINSLDSKSKKRFIIPDADISNVSMINPENISKISYDDLEAIIARYKASGAYILVFSFDDIENKVSINVSYIRKLQKKQVKLSFVNTSHLSYPALLQKVSEKTIAYLIESQANQSKEAVANSIKIEIPISNLGNWLAIKNKIENSNLVTQLNIESISKDHAVISVTYIDVSGNGVVESFAKAGIFLLRNSDNFYIFQTQPIINK